MSIKQTLHRKYIKKVNETRLVAQEIEQPSEGWMKTIRKALGMTLEQFASRSGLKRSRLCQIEDAELSGQINMNTLNKIAESVGCRVVYAIVPDKDIEEILDDRAQLMAEAAYDKVHRHTEGSSKHNKEEKISKIKFSLLSRTPTHLWRDTFLD